MTEDEGPTFTVGRFGSTYSITAEPLTRLERLRERLARWLAPWLDPDDDPDDDWSRE